MKSEEIREKFLKFFEERGHVVVPSSSLVPEGDSSVLFTSAGMQQFKPYYIGTKNPINDFNSKNVVSIQKCVRTSDIEEVGDERHLTFFEMLGNFSFGEYWKKEAITYAYDFVTKEMGLKIDYVTIFKGEDNIPEDTESAEIWKSIDSNILIKKCGREDNFWGPTGKEGPCGPTTEIYVNGIEIWNVVFNEFYQDQDKNFKPLETKGVDTGMGLERLAMVSQNVETVFDTDLFKALFDILPKDFDDKKKRVLGDHSRAIANMINDGVRPNNKDAGYILRRLLRRLLAQFELETIKLAIDLATTRFNINNSLVWEVIKKESQQFITALNMGVKELNKIIDITPESAFQLYNTYGLPLDVIKDKFPNLDVEAFNKKFSEHQELSRSGSDQKFKGGLGGHSEMEVRYHTATHLLHQALHDILGDGVEQKGSNITPERLRFDFSFSRKMTDEEKMEVERIVNEKIQKDLKVNKVTLSKEEALNSGARHLFDQKYPDEVNIYFIGDSLEDAYSKEFCGGPHVESLGSLGHFKIIKEEAISTGTRRIKAILE